MPRSTPSTEGSSTPTGSGRVPSGTTGYRLTMSDSCEHDFQVVNHDENREILKCTKCGELERE